MDKNKSGPQGKLKKRSDQKKNRILDGKVINKRTKIGWKWDKNETDTELMNDRYGMYTVYIQDIHVLSNGQSWGGHGMDTGLTWT
jgi:hypothetical protein